MRACMVLLVCFITATLLVWAAHADCPSLQKDDVSLVQRSVKSRSSVPGLIICTAPYTLCALATCRVMNNLAVCNCSYMGVNISATAAYTSKGPAQWTNEPVNVEDTCEYMKQLPSKAKVLSTYSGYSLPPNWPYPVEQTSYDLCTTNRTITAQCDGGICEVMNEAGIPKLDPSTWSVGDLSVCSCPLVSGADQIIVGGGTYTAGHGKHGKGRCKKTNPYCLPGPESLDPLGTYTVKIGAPKGVPEALDDLIERYDSSLPPVVPHENTCVVQ